MAFCRLDSCELDEGLRGRKFEVRIRSNDKLKQSKQ